MKMRAQILGDNLERIRKEKGITRKQLAESIGVSEVAVSQYATGANSPKLEKIFEIADVLKVSVASIIGENDFSDNAQIHKTKIDTSDLDVAQQKVEKLADTLQKCKELATYLSDVQISLIDKCIYKICTTIADAYNTTTKIQS